MRTLGRHLLLELYDCDEESINDFRRVEKAMLAAAKAAKAHVVDSIFHTFNPHGVSGVVVIAESHITIHTWPEFRFASIDIYTCGETADPWRACQILQKSFKAKNAETVELKRGRLDPTGNGHRFLTNGSGLWTAYPTSPRHFASRKLKSAAYPLAAA